MTHASDQPIERLDVDCELSDDELDAVSGGTGELSRPALTAQPLRPGFEDPLTAFEDPLTAFDNPIIARGRRP